MKKYICLIIASFLFASCEKVIDLDLKTSDPILVIEGTITDEPGPYIVKLSKTVNYSDANIYPPVSEAIVIIFDNTGVTDTLTEIFAGTFKTHNIKGIQGNTYTLKVLCEGYQYNAISTMPKKINLDSVKFNLYTEPGESEKNLAVVPLYLDPAELGNSYRFLFSANGKEDKSYQVSNDNIGNGRVNQQPFFSDNIKFRNGDTVKVTMLCIDQNTYNYYYTLSQMGGSGIIGGVIPVNPPGNISGNKALGLFSAYTIQIKNVIAQQ